MSNEWKRVDLQISQSTRTGKYRVHVVNKNKHFERDKRNIASLTEAKQLRDKWRSEALSAHAVYNITFDELFYNRYLPYREADTRIVASTLDALTSNWKQHISPAIGKLSVINNMPTASEIQRLVINGERRSCENESPLSHSTAIAAMGVLRSVVRYGAGEKIFEMPEWANPQHTWQYPPREPMLGADTIRDLWTDATALEATEILLQHNSPLAALWICIVGGGLRRQEAAPLNFEDLQFDLAQLDSSGTKDDFALVCRVYINRISCDRSKKNNQRKAALANNVSVDSIPRETCSDIENKSKNAHSERWVTITPPYSIYLKQLAEKHNPTDPICGNITDPTTRMSGSRISRLWLSYWPPRNGIDEAEAHSERCREGARLRWEIKLARCKLHQIEPDKPIPQLFKEQISLNEKLAIRPNASKAKLWHQRLDKVEAWLMQPDARAKREIRSELSRLEAEHEEHKRKRTFHGKAKPRPENQILRDFNFMQLRMGRAVHNSMCRQAGINDDLNELIHGRTPKTTGAKYYEAGSQETADMAAAMIHKWRTRLNASRSSSQKTNPNIVPIKASIDASEIKAFRNEAR